MPLINAARLFRVAHARYKAEKENSQTQACLIWLFSFSALHRLLKAGYGSRTRLSSLGSWRPTDRLILQTILSIINGDVKSKFYFLNLYLSPHYTTGDYLSIIFSVSGSVPFTAFILMSRKSTPIDTIMTIYGARYPKKKKIELEKMIREYKCFEHLKQDQFIYPEKFPSFQNQNLSQALKSIKFSFENNRTPLPPSGLVITQPDSVLVVTFDSLNS